MEYIEGEDLKSLLRRVGPLPEAKAMQLARQICQGLGAAHQAGVLHRDLKTANIMIDERGRARIADFGLAREQSRTDPQEDLVGSPTYMAPEQLAMNQTSVQSDLYSLGLILAEMLIGEAIHNVGTVKEIRELHESDAAARVVLACDDISPHVAEAIVKCLAKDPHDRPPNAAALAALLPGGSPLSAVFAAGETPSPDMVAASEKEVELGPRWRTFLLASVGILLLGVVLLSQQAFARLGVVRSLDSLADEASQLLDELHVPRAKYRASGYVADRSTLGRVANGELPPPSAVDSAGSYFWYRESQSAMVPLIPNWKGETFLRVGELRPVVGQPGSVHLRMDGRGRLRYLSAVMPLNPTPNADHSNSPANTDWPWPSLFEQAGFSAKQIAESKSIVPRFVPPAFVDQRWSWQFPEDVRVDAASFADRVSFFRVERPGNKDPDVNSLYGLAGGSPTLSSIMLLWIPLLLLGCGWLAGRNLNAKRADRKGAFLLARAAALSVMLIWLLGGTHLAGPSELDLFVTALAGATLMGTITWANYVAFEPLVRRYWPKTLVGWSRLLQGHYTDALVGRDLLIGVVAGVVAALGKLTIVEIPVWFGATSYGLPNIYNLEPLNGLRAAAAEAIAALAMAIVFSLFFQLLFLMTLRLAFRRTLVAVVVFVFFLSLRVAIQYQPMTLAFAVATIEMTMTAVIYLRIGLLAAVSMHFVRLLLKWPVTLNLSLWYSDTGIIALTIIGLLVVFAACTTRHRSVVQ